MMLRFGPDTDDQTEDREEDRSGYETEVDDMLSEVVSKDEEE